MQSHEVPKERNAANMRASYHEELSSVVDDLVTMTEKVSTAVEDATRSLLDADLEIPEVLDLGRLAVVGYGIFVDAVLEGAGGDLDVVGLDGVDQVEGGQPLRRELGPVRTRAGSGPVA